MIKRMKERLRESGIECEKENEIGSDSESQRGIRERMRERVTETVERKWQRLCEKESERVL